MNSLIFATNNANKITEVNAILSGKLTVISLKDAGIERDIPEPFDTLEENALTKARTIANITGRNCFSEDTGLFVDALNGEPGVRSARYAGEASNANNNIEKLLTKLAGIENRKAYFKTVVALILDKKEYLFEGTCKGTIIANRLGTSGFGYDPVFVPDGAANTFAEMSIAEKNIFSHRKKAISAFVTFLDKVSN